MVRELQRLLPEAAVVLSPGCDHTESQWAGDWPPVTHAGRSCSLRRVNSLPAHPGIYLAVQLNTGFTGSARPPSGLGLFHLPAQLPRRSIMSDSLQPRGL